jgi:hypothetical protein
VWPHEFNVEFEHLLHVQNEQETRFYYYYYYYFIFYFFKKGKWYDKVQLDGDHI